MLIRVQSPDGQKRVECTPNDSTEDLADKIQAAFGIECKYSFDLYKDRERKQLIMQHNRKCITTDYKLQHGDMIFLFQRVSDDAPKEAHQQRQSSSSSSNNSQYNSANSSNPSTSSFPSSSMSLSNDNNYSLSSSDSLQYPKLLLKPDSQDSVDNVLMKKSGLIERKPDAKYCRHGSNARCIHCTPIEPYDEGYLKENKIQHMSFNSYIKKMKSGVDKGKFASLENISCRIKPGCKGHLPWPDGICTKCQPSAVTLNPQNYRHVDNVTFGNVKIVDDFINYWRLTGKQRVGFLYGYYEEHQDVPLGIRAQVVAIYEPPQTGTRDSVKIHLDQLNFSDVDFVAEKLGIKRIGWIFTDLLAKDKKSGTVQCLRNDKTYLLSAQECIMAGFFQNYHPNKTSLSASGYFGSKFVTVVVTGNKDNQIHMEGYQVSNQCMALVNDKCLIPTRDAPEFAYVLESSSKQYVPDVFYKMKDKYGNSVTEIARPLPVEYLLIDVPVSTPKEPQYFFRPLQDKRPFPIENRHIEGHLQDFEAFVKYFKQFSQQQFLQAMMDFHFLIYLASMELVPLKDTMESLLDAIRNNDPESAAKWAKTDKWATVEQLCLAHSADFGSASTATSSASSSTNRLPWSCRHCTFENPGTQSSCEMCGLPKDN